MANSKRRPERPDEKARRLETWKDWGNPISPKDEAWLKVYKAAEVKRQARKTKDGEARLKQAEAKAKKEGRVLTLADLHKTSQPARPPTRKNGLRPEEERKALEVAARLDTALLEGQVESLAMAKAMALAGIPRSRVTGRQVSKVRRTGRGDWIAVTYTAADPGVELVYGADLVAIMAITDRVVRGGQRRLDFASLTDFVEGLSPEVDGEERKRWGGNSRKLAEERLKRAAGTIITVNFYRTEAQARALSGEHYRSVKFSIVRDYFVPDGKHLDAREAPLFGPYLEASEDFAQYLIGDPSHLIWFPTDVVQALASYPLRLALFGLIYPAALATKTFWEMSFEELMDILNETGRRPQALMGDIQIGLDHIHKLTNGRLKVHLVEAPEKRSGGRGRPKKRWVLQFGPSQALTRKAKGELKG